MEEKNTTRNSLLVLGSLLLVVGLSAIIPARWLGVKPAPREYTPVDFSQMKTAQDFTKDTNHDGKLTWKELVINNTDGTSTLQDIKEAKPDPEITKALNDPNNLTVSFSKNLYITSAYLKNNNITDAVSQQKAMTGITSEEVAKTSSKKYIYGDIKIATTENKESIRMYGNEIAKILNNIITKKNITEDFPGVKSFLDTGDDKKLVPIEKDAVRIDGMVKRLLALSVPQSATIYHLLVLNQVVVYRDTLSNLSKASTDPVRAAIVVQKYPESLLSTLLLYKKLSSYFTIKNIVFSPQEPGYVFMVGYTLQ